MNLKLFIRSVYQTQQFLLNIQGKLLPKSVYRLTFTYRSFLKLISIFFLINFTPQINITRLLVSGDWPPAASLFLNKSHIIVLMFRVVRDLFWSNNYYITTEDICRCFFSYLFNHVKKTEQGKALPEESKKNKRGRQIKNQKINEYYAINVLLKNRYNIFSSFGTYN